MTATSRPFVIPLRRRWVLAILPVICLLYFGFVVWLAATGRTIKGVPLEQLMLAGAGLFLFTFLVEVPFFFRRKGPREEPEELYEPSYQEEPPEPYAAPAREDDEVVATSETQQGLRVLEYSRPAKSRHKGAVYAKTYVPVTKEHVLRVETLAAEGRDL